MTVVVATENFELYHGVVNELRDRGVTFTTVEPGDSLPESATVLIRADGDELDVSEMTNGGETDGGEADDEGSDDGQPNVETVVADPEAPRRAVDEALARLRGGEGRTIVGVDPGTRPGIAVLSGDMVVAAFHVPLSDVVETVRREVADAVDPVVRIGDGARLQGAQIIRELEEVPVELVDETGTTPYLGTGARGMGDVLAAVNIARLDGERVEGRDVEPTAGELQVIQNRSREQADDNREIDEELARRVAAGDLTLEEAMDEHRND